MLTESTLLLFGLFMIAAAAGWGFARYLDRQIHDDEEDEPGLSQGYARALNLLLNQETDKALDLFVRMVATDDEALDTHFALGSLFRRRGEVDRAIRIHENILARASLSETQHEAALSALGEDYLKAGLLDRAEEVFEKLSSSARDPVPALQQLIGIHETLGDWQRALEGRRELERVGGESQAMQIGHCLCEIAENEAASGNVVHAEELLRQAYKGCPTLLRALWQGARLAESQGDMRRAWQLLERVVRSDTVWLPDLLPEMIRVARARDAMPALDALLRDLLARDPQVQRRLAYAAILADSIEPPVVGEAVRAFIAGSPTLNHLVDVEALSAELSSGGPYLQRVIAGLRRLAVKVPRYQCNRCGYSTHRLGWQCQRCKSWQSNWPITEFPYHALIMRENR